MLFPIVCPGCGVLGAAPCAACLAGMRRVADRALPAPPGITRLVAPFAYAGPLRPLLRALKYDNQRAALGWLGAELALAWQLAGLSGTRSWAPTGAARARRRGFDQAELLAWASVGAAAGIARADRPVALLRREPGPAQTGRPRQQRAEVAGFALRRPWWRAASVVPSRVVLIDDVVTTGATLAAAAAVLLAAGCTRVDALVVAWTPPPSSRRHDFHAVA